MNIKELTIKTINDIEKRRAQKEREYFEYTIDKHYKKIRNWNVRAGGCRW